MCVDCWNEVAEEETAWEGNPGLVPPFTDELTAHHDVHPADMYWGISDSSVLLMETLQSKNSDYRVTGEFSNFEQAAEFADATPLQVMLCQIGIKMTRIKGLMMNTIEPNNESLRDSFLDLAGYSVIAHAYLTHMETPLVDE